MRTQAERTKAYEEKKKSQGYVRMWLWVKPEHRQPIREYARKVQND